MGFRGYMKNFPRDLHKKRTKNMHLSLSLVKVHDTLERSSDCAQHPLHIIEEDSSYEKLIHLHL